MKLIITILLTLITLSSFSLTKHTNIKPGRWVGSLELSSGHDVFFEMNVNKKNDGLAFFVINGEEVVEMKQPEMVGDSVHVSFKNFNTELIFHIDNSKQISGRWLVHFKANYQIPFSAKYSEESIFPVDNQLTVNDFNGKWETLFSPDKSSFAALGLFHQKGNQVTGTFMTETGDFRFLAGNVSGNSMYLSGFDGSHCFLFEATLNENGQLEGDFFSGNHYQTNWTAKRNENYELKNAYTLTKIISDTKNYSFEQQNLDGSPFVFPNSEYENDVVIIQIMGTWCGNCMDETVYYKTLYDKYHKKGLEIISVGYEAGETFEDYASHLLNYKKRFDIKHKIIVGGNSSKESAKSDFSFLSDVTAFPTSIFINRKGEVVKIHTGFSGPSTGEYFNQYQEKTEDLIERLLSE